MHIVDVRVDPLANNIDLKPSKRLTYKGTLSLSRVGFIM